MKLALFTHLSWPEKINQPSVFYNAVDQVHLAESIGFDSAWFAEHHFTRYSMGASLLVILGHIAATTKSIRLGTGVLIPNLHNPIRLAEDTATVDVLSNGRLDVGFGRGVYGYEYGGFNIQADQSQERFQETVLSIRDLWSNKSVSMDGRFHQLKNIDLVPSPIQVPHPPVYIAATRSPDTLDFLISNDFLLCIAVVQDTKLALQLVSRYKEKCKAVARSPQMDKVPFFRYVHVAENESQAIENTKTHIDWIQDIMQWKRHLLDRTEVYQPMDEWLKSRNELPPTFDQIRDNRAFIGTPEHVAEQILGLREHGIEYFGCNFAMGGLTQEKIIASMKLFEKRVIPLIQ